MVNDTSTTKPRSAGSLALDELENADLATGVCVGEQFEAYVECKSRNRLDVEHLLERLIPRRSLGTTFEYPGYEPAVSFQFDSVEHLLGGLELRGKLPYVIYFNNLEEGDTQQVILVYTEDGGLLLGLASRAPDWLSTLAALAAETGAQYGYALLEELPAPNMEAFRQYSKSYRGDRIVQGKIFASSWM